MKSNWFNKLLHVWIAVTSLVAFLLGWVFLGHSGKPVSGSSVNNLIRSSELTPLPTLAPLPMITNSGSSGFQPQQPSFQFAQPRFRTRGS